MERKYIVKGHRRVVFFFKLEPPKRTELHIFIRHKTKPHHAIGTFFEGKSKWNILRRRWETTDEQYTVYWYWLSRELSKVMIITCFRNNFATHE